MDFVKPKNKILSGELCLSSNSVTLPKFFKLINMQDVISLNGGKIVKQAKVLPKSKNMLNSMRLNDANQWPNNIQKINISTDCRNNRKTIIFTGIELNQTRLNQTDNYVYKEQLKLVILAGSVGSGTSSVRKLQRHGP